MFHYIRGKLDSFGEDYIVIDNSDIGYRIFTSNQTILSIKENHDKITIYTQMIVREDDINIIGFATKEELKMFQLLTTVTGVGAKVALGILSSFSLGRLAGMIISEDINSLTKAQGVGKKTAQRILLELKDKVDQRLAVVEPTLFPTVPTFDEPDDEVISALIGLGYNRGEAISAINLVKDSCKSVEDMLKKALKVLSK